MSVPAVASFIGAGVGAALWATFGILAFDKDAQLDGSCMASCTPEQVGDLEMYNVLADIGFGVTLVGAALGVVFLLLDGGDDGDEQAQARVVPMAGPSLLGVSVTGAL